MTPETTTHFERLRERVRAVGRRHQRCAVTLGAGRLAWCLGLPLLAVVLLAAVVHLPFYLRAPLLPVALGLAVWWGWRWVARPLRSRYSLTRAALLVEAQRPELRSRVVSALELYPRLAESPPPFEPAMVEALVAYAQESTAADDFRAVVDARPARRHLIAAAVTGLAWVLAFVLLPSAMLGACRSLVTAWAEMGELAQRAGGARIEIEPLAQRAYLAGSDVTLRAVQKGFHRERLDLRVRPVGGEAWTQVSLPAGADGRVTHTVQKAQKSFEFYLASGRIESERRTAVVTERPRIVALSVEYELPEYVRRAPIVQPRSDGNLQALYGSTVVLTIEANKDLDAAELRASFQKQPEALSVGGRYARCALRLAEKAWLANPAAVIHESYRLRLRDEYGFTNADADRDFALEIVKDAAPVIQMVGLPHRSPEEEPHVLEEKLGAISVSVQARDDYGVRKIVLRYRIEDLDSGRELAKNQKERQFPLPRTEVPVTRLVRLDEIGAKVGDRIVFWAEAEDAYDLEPEKGPNLARTPVYRVAIVTQEALFTEVRYKDSWSVPWYDRQKIATLSPRATPERLAPPQEPPAVLAARLLDTPPVTDSLPAADRLLAQDYFDSLNAGK